MQKRLTEAAVANLKPHPEKRLEIHDAVYSGLRLRISPSGRKSWSFMYKVAGEAIDGGRGKNRRITLGQYPFVGLKTAREKATEVQALADKGIDPINQRKNEIEERFEKRFSSVIPRYIKLHAKPNTKRWKETGVLLETSIGSRWAELDITSVNRTQVHALLDEITEQEGISKAREVRKHLSILFNWAVDRGICPFNPMAGMKLKDLSPVKREKVLSIDELCSIWKAADIIGYPFGPVVQLLILSGQRRSEIGSVRRRWISDRQIEIPSENYKTGVSHIIPLTDRMKEILDSQPIWNGDDFVFSTTNGRSPSSGFSRTKRKFDELTGLTGWTFHDIRRSVATHMAQSSIIQEHIERVLGHVISGVAGTYNRYSYFDEKLGAMQAWQNQLPTK